MLYIIQHVTNDHPDPRIDPSTMFNINLSFCIFPSRLHTYRSLSPTDDDCTVYAAFLVKCLPFLLQWHRLIAPCNASTLYIASTLYFSSTLYISSTLYMYVHSKMCENKPLHSDVRWIYRVRCTPHKERCDYYTKPRPPGPCILVGTTSTPHMLQTRRGNTSLLTAQVPKRLCLRTTGPHRRS